MNIAEDNGEIGEVLPKCYVNLPYFDRRLDVFIGLFYELTDDGVLKEVNASDQTDQQRGYREQQVKKCFAKLFHTKKMMAKVLVRTGCNKHAACRNSYPTKRYLVWKYCLEMTNKFYFPFANFNLLMLLLSGSLLFSCAPGEPRSNQLTQQEQEEGWELLFDGKSTEGWHLYNKGKIVSAWSVRGDELYCDPQNIDIEHGDLVTDGEYENFHLKFEWKISEKGNSGVFFNVQESPEYPTAWTTGPEYQLLENTHHDYANELKRPGCVFGFAPQKNEALAHPAGQWNQSEIRQENGRIQFYLNGVLTAEEDLTTPAWAERVSQTSFKNFPDFSKRTKGHLALQDWSKGISFRNVKIRKL